jgi:tyrosyl-tRNA synthetase
MLLQANDFLQLFELHSCTIQAGGSDQWGNITAGIDRVRKARHAEVYGFTHPLLSTAGACASKGEANRLIRGGGVYLNNHRISAEWATNRVRCGRRGRVCAAAWC